jgi:hypothetical protein
LQKGRKQIGGNTKWRIDNRAKAEGRKGGRKERRKEGKAEGRKAGGWKGEKAEG